MKYIKNQSLPKMDDPILNRALDQINEELDKIARVFIDWTDATQNFKTTGNAEALALTLAGNLRNPGQPAFLAYNSATDPDVTGDNTLATVDFDTEVFDQGGDFAADIFTAPVDGKYLLTACVLLSDLELAAYNDASIYIITSNRIYQTYISGEIHTVDGHQSLQISAIVDMDADDTAYVAIRVNGGAKTIDIFGSSTLFTYFSGVLIC